MDQAVHLYEEARYTDAIASLEDILARTEPRASLHLRALLYVGCSHVALEHAETARLRFRELLKTDVDYKLPPNPSPKIRRAFEAVRLEVRDAPRLVSLGPSLFIDPADQKPQLRFRFQSFRVEGLTSMLYWRWRGESVYRPVPLFGKGDLVATVSIETSRSREIEYYATVQDKGRLATSLASALEPLSYLVPDPKEQTVVMKAPPIYKQWWFWTSIGVLLAGAGAVTGVVIYNQTQPTTATLNFTIPGASR